jgi:hypothetical protein
MTTSATPAPELFERLYAMYQGQSNAPPDLLRQALDAHMNQMIAAYEQAPAMLIWFFMQLRMHWLDLEQGGVADEAFCPPLLLQQVIVERLWAMLIQIEQGVLTIAPVYNPHQTLGAIPYIVSNGWVVEIYSRIYVWHRLDTFTTPDKIEFDPWFLPSYDLCQHLLNYDPSAEVQERIYGFHQVS